MEIVGGYALGHVFDRSRDTTACLMVTGGGSPLAVSYCTTAATQRLGEQERTWEATLWTSTGTFESRRVRVSNKHWTLVLSGEESIYVNQRPQYLRRKLDVWSLLTRVLR